MTLLATRTLGPPRAAILRGGDVRARDLAQVRNVLGPHRFAATTDLRITNGLLRLDVGATGAAPTVTVSFYKGSVPTGDALSDTLSNTLEGSMTAGAWLTAGVITFDSPAVTATMTAAHLLHVTPNTATIRLVSAAMADAYLTLRRGERMVRIQHGATRSSTVTTTRRVRWAAATPGTATSGRVTETTPANAGYPRFLAALDAVTTDGAAFSMTTSTSVRTGRFAAGVGTDQPLDTPADMHAQLAGHTRQELRVV